MKTLMILPVIIAASTLFLTPPPVKPFTRSSRGACLAVCTAQVTAAPLAPETWAVQHNLCVSQCYGMYGDNFCGVHCQYFKLHEHDKQEEL